MCRMLILLEMSILLLQSARSGAHLLGLKALALSARQVAAQTDEYSLPRRVPSLHCPAVGRVLLNKRQPICPITCT